jgi:tetratricopeptide (TPR) repeat protein
VLAWKWTEAEKSFQQALGLGEHAGTYRQYGLLLAALGRLDEAWNYLQKAQQIDPFSCRQKVFYTKFYPLCRNCEQGVNHVSQQLVYGPLPIESEIYRAMMLISLDRRDEARQMAQDFPCKAGAQPVMMSGVAEVLAML